MKKEVKNQNIEKSKRKISIITVFLWIFLVATMITILTENIKNTNAIESENKSRVEVSAFKDEILSPGDTCNGRIILDGGSIEDSGLLCMETGYVTKYILWDVVDYKSESNIVNVVVSKKSITNNKGLSIKFEPGTGRGTTEISIGIMAYYGDENLVLVNLDYIVTNEPVFAEEINPSDLSIKKEAEKDKYNLGTDVSFNITVTNKSDRKISHLKIVDYCENCEDIIFTAPDNINGTVEDFSLDAGGSVTFRVTIEDSKVENLVDGNKIINHAYLYIGDGTKIGEDTAETTVEIPIVYSSYKVKHEYYRKDMDDNLILEDTVISDVVNNVIIGTKVGISDENEVVDIEVEKILKNTIEGIEYTYEYLENSGNVIIEEDTIKEITIKYVREEIEKIPEKVAIKVEKIWEDNNDENGKRPENVILQIKNKDKIVEEILVDENNNWSYEFLLLKYDENGEEIEYTVDEKETSKYYEKVIDGYRVINKYIEENSNDIINEENVSTSDINVVCYIVLLFVSIISIILLRKKIS